MPPSFSFPEGHWNWPVQLSHQHAVRAGEFIFTGGQVDLDPQGKVQHPGELTPQCNHSMDYLNALLGDLQSDALDLVKLVVYYVGDIEAKLHIQRLIADKIGADSKPVINMVCMPSLCYPEMLIEIEGVAMRAVSGARLDKTCFHDKGLPQLHSAFSHVVRCGELVFTSDMSAVDSTGEVQAPNDITEQTRLMMDNLNKALALAGSDMDDVLKINAFFTQGTDEASWSVPATIRADHFQTPGPAVTGIPLKEFVHHGQMTQIFATANYGVDRNTRTVSWPVGHWDWTSPLPYKHANKSGQLIHVGGQVSLDTAGNVLDPDNMVVQTRTAMQNIANVLAEFGAGLQDIVKVTAFYEGKASAHDLHENLQIRSNCYVAGKGPATTGVPVPNLIYDQMVIEIEVIAVVE